ncbi:MAG: adenylate cyclase [Alphaproteobacteria bacterium]
MITGEMGYSRARQFTAIGDTVNVASRLESLTKEHRCQLVLSGDAARHAGADLSGYPCLEVEVRGLSRPLPVVLVADAVTLPGESLKP